jgi:hypothetical protein
MMRVLLVGEFSRLHNSLKEGLEKLGHDVFIIGIGGDSFKNYPVDIDIDVRFLKYKIPEFIAKVIRKLTKIDLFSIERVLHFLWNLHLFKGYDVVQLINEQALRTFPKAEIFLLKKLMKYNKKMFVLSCSVDSINMEYAFARKFKYSVITPLLENPKDVNVAKSYAYYHVFKTEKYQELSAFIYKNVNGVVSSDMDYHLPLLGHEKYLGLIPNPINNELIEPLPFKQGEKIKIFHAINSRMYLQKGNVYFEKALKIISEKYSDLVEITVVKNVLYTTYINMYNDCHILLDQIFAYDQGYNALEAMAKGKVVFTGAEEEFLEFYGLEKNEVCINAEPCVDSVVKELENLILNPIKLEDISNNAVRFIEKEHNYIKIAQKYIAVWNSN